MCLNTLTVLLHIGSYNKVKIITSDASKPLKST